MNNKKWYEVLNVSSDADTHEIKQAFRRLVKLYHPDRNKSPDAEEKFKEIKEAYEQSLNPQDQESENKIDFEELFQDFFKWQEDEQASTKFEQSPLDFDDESLEEYLNRTQEAIPNFTSQISNPINDYANDGYNLDFLKKPVDNLQPQNELTSSKPKKVKKPKPPKQPKPKKVKEPKPPKQPKPKKVKEPKQPKPKYPNAKASFLTTNLIVLFIVIIIMITIAAFNF